MKILTGSLRGQPIVFKPSPGLRPTADKVRKALFDILRGCVEGSSVLDLYSGTGALGLEALSLGAAKAVLVEENRARCRQIEENIKRLGLTECAFTLALAVPEAVNQLSRYADYFDIILMDPPYQTGAALETLKLVAASKIVHAQTWIAAEVAAREELPGQVGGFKNVRNKVYGDTRIMIYAPLER